jgi:hypothetical protein
LKSLTPFCKSREASSGHFRSLLSLLENSTSDSAHGQGSAAELTRREEQRPSARLFRDELVLELWIGGLVGWLLLPEMMPVASTHYCGMVRR